MAYIIQKFEAFDLWKIEQHETDDFTTFVLRIYYEHHLQIPAPIAEVEACIKEDRRLAPHSHFYALKTKEGKIFGTINACLWNGKDELAIEREYAINVNELIKTQGLNPHQVWHIGRFAIDRKIINQHKALRVSQGLYFRLLMTCAFAHICTHPENLMVVESDEKLYKTGKLLGIFTQPLGESHFILGSNALPVMDTGAGLLPFFNKHKHLLRYVQ